MRVVYKITNLVTNKIYIGKDSCNRKNYFGSGIAIINSIKKHGIENFKKEIIDEAESLEEINLKEIYWIKFYNSNDYKIGYNRSSGGDGFNNFKTMNKESFEKGLKKRRKIWKSKKWKEARRKCMLKYYSDPNNVLKQSIRIKKYYDNRTIIEKELFSEIRSKASLKSWKNNSKRKQNLINRMKYNNPMLNPETRKKLSLSRMGCNNPSAVKIEVDNIIYDSISIACRVLNITRNSIVKRLKSKNYKSYKRIDMKKEETKENTNFQQCAQLEVKDNYKILRDKGEDALELIFNMQKSIQEDIYGYDFKEIQSSIRNLKSYIDMNEEAIRDEDRELQSALTGIHTYPNCWKPWKSKHEEAMNRSLSDLTPDELKELHMEWIDKLHFFMSEGIALGLTPDLITNYYVSKNLHNAERQNKEGGY